MLSACRKTSCHLGPAFQTRLVYVSLIRKSIYSYELCSILIRISLKYVWAVV